MNIIKLIKESIDEILSSSKDEDDENVFHPEHRTREKFAKHTPNPAYHDILVNDSWHGTRYALSNNPHISVENTLKLALHDPEEYVRDNTHAKVCENAHDSPNIHNVTKAIRLALSPECSPHKTRRLIRNMPAHLVPAEALAKAMNDPADKGDPEETHINLLHNTVNRLTKLPNKDLNDLIMASNKSKIHRTMLFNSDITLPPEQKQHHEERLKDLYEKEGRSLLANLKNIEF